MRIATPRAGALAALAVGLLAVLTSPALAGAPRAGLEGVPSFNHVFVIVLENEDYGTTWSATSPAKYLNSLRPQGVFADNYFGASHNSLDNYIAMTSGQTPTPAFQADCPNWAACVATEEARPDKGRSIADQLQDAHLSWAGYMETMKTPCEHPALTAPADTNQSGYATRHDPFVYYPPIEENVARCDAHVRPYTDLVASLRAGGKNVPDFSFITPDTCDDGHDAPCADGRPGGLKSADAWLKTNVPLIMNSAAFKDRGVLFITTDESGVGKSGAEFDGCCGSGVTGTGLEGGGRVGLLALSPLVRPGSVTDVYYDHASLLRTIEDGFGIKEHLNQAGASNEHAMRTLFP